MNSFLFNSVLVNKWKAACHAFVNFVYSYLASFLPMHGRLISHPLSSQYEAWKMVANIVKHHRSLNLVCSPFIFLSIAGDVRTSFKTCQQFWPPCLNRAKVIGEWSKNLQSVFLTITYYCMNHIILYQNHNLYWLNSIWSKSNKLLRVYGYCWILCPALSVQHFDNCPGQWPSIPKNNV